MVGKKGVVEAWVYGYEATGNIDHSSRGKFSQPCLSAIEVYNFERYETTTRMFMPVWLLIITHFSDSYPRINVRNKRPTRENYSGKIRKESESIIVIYETIRQQTIISRSRETNP